MAVHFLPLVMVLNSFQEAEGNLDSARMELTQVRERSDSELSRLGSEYDLKRQSLEDLEVSSSLQQLPTYQSQQPVLPVLTFAYCA